jgi:hypothetical protein
LPGLLLFGRRGRKLRASLRAIVLLLLLSGVAVSLNGCGGASTPPGSSGGGTYTVEIIATGTSGVSQSANLTLTVQ